MKVRIKDIDEILRDTDKAHINIRYDAATDQFNVTLYGISGGFVVRSIAGCVRDAELTDIKSYFSQPWYLPAVWIKEIIEE